MRSPEKTHVLVIVKHFCQLAPGPFSALQESSLEDLTLPRTCILTEEEREKKDYEDTRDIHSDHGGREGGKRNVVQ